MYTKETVALIIKNDKAAIKEVFEKCYGKMAAIAHRYCKNQDQATDAINEGFNAFILRLQHSRYVHEVDFESVFEKEFINSCAVFIKSISSEYYVASTVHVLTESSSKNYNLFENNEFIDYNAIDTDVLIKSLQQLVPSQRLVINLHIIDGFTLEETALILESNVQTIKSNLEKARYNLQKNIKNCYKTLKNEQSL